MARQSIRPKMRFDIFKRDGFQCQYCGRKVPEVTLEVDHIIPACDGGSDAPENLLTSCFECNRGKGGERLERIPLPDRSDILEEAEERRLQMQEYYNFEREAEQLIDDQTDEALAYWATNTYSKSLPDRPSVRRFIKLLGYHEVIDAIDITFSKRSCDRIRYFFGVLHTKRRNKEERNGQA